MHRENKMQIEKMFVRLYYLGNSGDLARRMETFATL